MRLPRSVIPRVGVLLVALISLAAATLIILHNNAVGSEPTRTVLASADTYVSTAHSNENYGTSEWLRLDSTPRITSYLRFDLGESHQRIATATLRLRAGSAEVGELQVRGLTNSSWGENTLTAENSPPYGAPLDAPVDRHEGWVSVDVTPLIQNQRIIDFALTAGSSTPMRFRSREGSSPPELVLRLGDGPSTDSSAASEFANVVEDVSEATAKSYATRDDLGASMDSLKIVSIPLGGYLGVYHTQEAGVFVARVATSADLLKWTRRAVIDEHASQPTIAVLADRSVLVAEEADSNGSPQGSRAWLRLRHYRDIAALLASQPARSLDLPHTRVPEMVGAEGTPDIRSVQLRPDIEHSTIEIGFHYYSSGKVDRMARGVLTNFQSWNAWPDAELDADMARVDVTGSIGDRDTVDLDDQRLALIEARGSIDAGWQIYLYDESRREARRLNIRTDSKSTAFANPTVSILRAPSGARAIVVTLFIPVSGAARGEAGELVYYREITPRPASADPVVAAAGDIACAVGQEPPSARECAQEETAKVIEDMDPTAVLALGDEQYERGTLEQFLDSYDASWGRFRQITYPVLGNHEYDTPGAAGYFDYFGPAAGDRRQGWYSFDLGAWHAIALNSQCAEVGGCGKGSAQERWLAEDLAAHPAGCTLAYWHEPLFSSGDHGGNTELTAIWDNLQAAGVEIVLTGHDHDYERFAPQNSTGQLEASSGVRQFVIGTGGKSLREFEKPAANSEIRNAVARGVLRLDLHADGYDWRFVSAEDSRFSDQGSGQCH